jgi:predicted dehydrogenase
MINVVVIGWGRMGITHASILGGLFSTNISLEVVESHKFIRRILSSTLKYKVYSDVKKVDFSNKYVIISTPPHVHAEIADYVFSKGAKFIFIEKPFGLINARVSEYSNLMVGYVLRYTDVAQELKRQICERGCTEISLSYMSNTLQKKPSGWRNTKNGGVLNEMGSHLIDLLFYLLGDNKLEIYFSTFENVISDFDDRYYFEGKLGDSKVMISLDWVNANYRKPIWAGYVIDSSGKKIIFDQQSIDTGLIPTNVPYYVRGKEFSLQMLNFIGCNTKIGCTATEANIVNDSIENLRNRS